MDRRKTRANAKPGGASAMSSWGKSVRGGGGGGAGLGAAGLPSGGAGKERASSANPTSRSTLNGRSSASATAATVDPIRKFQDFCDRFPVSNPSEAVGVGSPSSKALPVVAPAVALPAEANPEVEVGEGGGPPQGRDASRRTAKDSAAKSYQVLRRHKVDQWSQLADKHNRRLRKENEVLSRIAAVTQEAALNNDERHEEAVAALRAQVEYTSLYRSADSETMSFVRENMTSIRDRMAEILDASEAQVASELGNIRESFERQVQLRDAELAEAQASEQDTTEEWRRHSRELQEQLDCLLRDTDTAFGRHKRLLKEHQRLRIENDAQADDAVLLGRQWNLVSAQHQRLRDRVQELELELAGDANNDDDGEDDDDRRSGSRSPSAPRGGGGGGGVVADAPLQRAQGEDDDAHVQRLGAALDRAKVLLGTEQSSLEQVRHSHVAALQQRTELEVYLRCAVLHHQRNLATAHYAERQNRAHAVSGGWGASGRRTASSAAKTSESANGEDHAAVVSTSFTADDRRVVVESLLAVPRVLELLYRAGTTDRISDTDHHARGIRPHRGGGGGGGANLNGSQHAKEATPAAAAAGPCGHASPPDALRADLLAMGMPSATLDRAAKGHRSDGATDQDHHSIGGTDGAAGMERGAQTIDEAALARLWERWQGWTASAQHAISGAHRGDGAADP